MAVIWAVTGLTPHTGPHNASDGQLELYLQLKAGAPPVAYWDAVARCETGQRGPDGIKRPNWQNRGHFAGGLGIMTQGTYEQSPRGTWEWWGGEQFASSPDRATRIQQLVVANRIAMFGFQTSGIYRTWEDRQANRSIFKHPVGYFGFSCARDIVGNPCGKLKNGGRGSWQPPRRYRVLHCR